MLDRIAEDLVNQLAGPGGQRQFLQERLHFLGGEVAQAALAEAPGDVLGHEPVVRDRARVELQAGQPSGDSLTDAVGG